ncbi:MAG: DUF192 domain-containing protein [Oligoflexia bacterium]|nr:DUF192 domain-containing protein [Oligoflexia bacterium]
MFKKEMKTFINEESFDGLLIESCNSIHTCFMRFNIDVLFLNKENEIVSIIRNMKPWRITWMYFKAKKVLELNAGIISGNTNVGDKVEIICSN